MAVQEQTPLQEYTANGITTQFDLEFDCESADHLIVSIDDLEVLHTDWYLSGNAIMFHVAPANGKQVKIQRNTPFNRIADYQSYNNSFRPPAINKDFDRIWWKLQELGVADWILHNRIDALKAYVDDRDDELRAYLMEEIRKQGVALDQLDEYYNYLMQRLAQIAVDKGWDASFVTYNGQTQQKINDGFSSIAEMLSITKPKDGMRVFVKGLQGGWFEYNSDKSGINNGVTVFNGWARISMEMGIKPEWAGAPHDGVNDDADAIRKCIAYCETYGAKRIIFTNNGKNYIAATVDANNSAFTIKSIGIMLDFETTDTVIEAKVAMGSILYFQSTSYQIGINNGVFSCNNLANYGINTNPAIYTPQIEIHSLTIMNPVEDGVVVQAYVGDISKLTVNGGKRGLVIKPVLGNIVTSLNIRSCYMLNQTVVGYDLDVTCYCVLIGCAADNMPLAYSLNMRGGAMIACGAENIEKIARFTSFRGLSINGFYSQRAGSTDSENPTDYLLEFVTGTNATLAGFHLESNAGRYYGKKVGITTKNYAYESLTVTDQSISRSDIYFIANSGSNRPIKLLFGDTTQRDLTVNINSMAQFREYIATYLDDYEINHTLTIQLANGTYNFGDIPSVINSLRGTGRLIIRGNASNRESVKLETEIYQLIVRNCQCLVEFRDLTLSGTVASAAAERLRVDGSNVQLTNVLISRNGISTSYGIRALSGSVVRISSATEADSNAFGVRPFGSDATSRFVIDPVSAAPTTLNWSAGMTVENTNPTTHLGWVFSGGAWKTYGAIT